MKISKPARIFLTSGILVILVASLAVAYFNQTAEQHRLNDELALAQVRLNEYPAQLQQISSQRQELESRLAEAESQLQAAEVSLDQSTESIAARDTLLVIARGCNVEVTEFSSERPGSETLEGVPFSALHLTVTVAGDVLSLIDFVYYWTEEYPTGMVESVEIGEEISSATIELLIYSYEGG
jgi:hypothetical protein